MEAAAATTLEVVHETRYDYAAPVALAHHLAHLQPLDDDYQRLLAHEVVTEPPVDWRHAGTDAFGNACLWLSSAQLHERLRVRSTSRVALRPRFAALQPAAAPAWDELAAALRFVAGGRYDPAVAFVQPSPYVPRLPELLDHARPSLLPGRPVAEAAIDLMHRLHADFAYRSDSTEIDTPLATAFAQRAGVCQDFAHLLAGALRMAGVPARYVSGYLLTQPPEGGSALLGADASHAWVQVYSPGTPGVPADWLDLDPTNDCVPGCGHVRVALGRDFGDVTPLRGVIRGGGRHTLSVAVGTRVIDPGLALANGPAEEMR
ncbi:MAG: transglutaminase family protein [Rubrivivax sp.]|nr:transglutaminase family protein [Rubrivivax sp.]